EFGGLEKLLLSLLPAASQAEAQKSETHHGEGHRLRYGHVTAVREIRQSHPLGRVVNVLLDPNGSLGRKRSAVRLHGSGVADVAIDHVVRAGAQLRGAGYFGENNSTRRCTQHVEVDSIGRTGDQVSEGNILRNGQRVWIELNDDEPSRR